MAAKSSSPIDDVEVQRLLDAPKEAGESPLWTAVEHPTTGQVVRKVLHPLALAIAPEPAAGSLLVMGQWRRSDAIQIRLVLAMASTEHNVARLCLDPRHGKDLHWHYREDVAGKTEQVSVSHPPGTLSEETMLFDVFIPTMNITNVPQKFAFPT